MIEYVDKNVRIITVSRSNIKELFQIVDNTKYNIPVCIICEDVIETNQELQKIFDIIDMCLVEHFYISCKKEFFQNINTRRIIYNLTDDGRQVYIYSSVDIES